MRYAAPEHLLFVRNGTLMANRFDANRLKLVGEAIPIAEDIGAFAASENGWLVHRRNANPAAAPTHHLLWFDRKGNPAGQAGPPSTYDHISLSLQGDRVAFDSSDSGNRDIRVMDLKKGDQSYRLTFNDAHETFPVWSPDGGQLIFASTRDGSSRIPFRLYQKSTRGTGSENLLFTSSNPAHTVLPYDWSSDEKYLIFVHQGAIKAIDLRSGGDPITILKVQSMKVQPHLSPNGRWLAYVTEERGRYQVIVQTFPDPTRGKWQVTEKGGVEPRWSRDGSELFYLALDGKLMAVPIKAGESFDYGAPVELFQTPLNALVGSSHRYDVAPGQRFLLNVPLVGPNNETNSPPITAVINWTADLNKR
jgi:hypothetical protein